MCSLIAFGSRTECHASKNNLFDPWEQRSMILTSSRSKSWFVFIQCWVNSEFLSPVKIALFVFASLSWILGPLILADINFVAVFTIYFIDHSCWWVSTLFFSVSVFFFFNGANGFVSNVAIKLISSSFVFFLKFLEDMAKWQNLYWFETVL